MLLLTVACETVLNLRTEPKNILKLAKNDLRSAALVSVLAKRVEDPALSRSLELIADSLKKQAKMWVASVDQSQVLQEGMGAYGTALYFVARVFGISRVVSILALKQRRMLRGYMSEPHIQEIVAEKRKTMLEFREIIATTAADPGNTAASWHKAMSAFLSGQGGNLRAAVLGVNDGLVSNLSLVMGVAGGTNDAGIIILAGVASLIAGAFSMAAGEYISVRSQRDVYENLIQEEMGEIELFPEEEKRDIASIFEKKGLTVDEANTVAERLFQNKEVALDTLVKENIGLSQQDLGSPNGVAISSMIAFALGALVPLLPFLFTMNTEWPIILISAVLSGLALLTVGAALAWVTGVNIAWGSTRMLIVGGVAAAVTFGIGSAVGVAIN